MSPTSEANPTVDPLVSVRLRIFGKVQGVGFRFWTKVTAERLGLTGGVRNEADGTVSALLYGEHSKIEEFTRMAREGGPPSGRVTQITVQEKVFDSSTPKSFEIWR